MAKHVTDGEDPEIKETRKARGKGVKFKKSLI
jgi:hypothetical protein